MRALVFTAPGTVEMLNVPEPDPGPGEFVAHDQRRLAEPGMAGAVQLAAADPGRGQLALLAHVEADVPDNRMNDGACDRAGRFFAGTMAEDESPGAGTAYRFDPDHGVTAVLHDVSISNGIGWSLDESRMYYVDSLTHSVDVFDYDTTSGAIGNRRVFAAVGGEGVAPDGLAVDADGCVWVALWGGSALVRYGPDGRLRQTLEIPAANVTCCAFGGADLATLYITTAAGPGAGGGALFPAGPGPLACPPTRSGADPPTGEAPMPPETDPPR